LGTNIASTSLYILKEVSIVREALLYSAAHLSYPK